MTVLSIADRSSRLMPTGQRRRRLQQKGNFYIVQYFDWRVRPVSWTDRVATRILKLVGIELNVRLSDIFDKVITQMRGVKGSFVFSGITSNVEQRMNMYHLVKQVLAYNIDGDLVELGCFEGESSVLITKILLDHGTEKKLAVYDSFQGLPDVEMYDGKIYKKSMFTTTEAAVKRNFERYSLPLPEIHRGWLEDTLKNGLPDTICFAFLDAGISGSTLFSLLQVYPRLAKGAICLINDYCDPAIDPLGWNKLPGVKKACDEFFEDKPEIIEPIYSGEYSQAYFRKL